MTVTAPLAAASRHLRVTITNVWFEDSSFTLSDKINLSIMIRPYYGKE